MTTVTTTEVTLEPTEKQLNAFLDAIDLENHCCGCGSKSGNYTLTKWKDGVEAMNNVKE
jgi:hypothetical protein